MECRKYLGVEIDDNLRYKLQIRNSMYFQSYLRSRSFLGMSNGGDNSNSLIELHRPQHCGVPRETRSVLFVIATVSHLLSSLSQAIEDQLGYVLGYTLEF